MRWTGMLSSFSHATCQSRCPSLLSFFTVQWGFFEKQLGRKDADGPDPAGRVPVWSELSGTEIKEALLKLGLRPPQVTERFPDGRLLLLDFTLPN